MVRTQRPRRVVDLGCGTGELTAVLHRELRAAETVGVDSSPAMLARAAELDVPGLRFSRADIAEWTASDPLNVVFSNAALHWLPDHPGLFARLAAMLAPGGEIAVQVPANFDHPSHTIAAALAQEEPFATELGGYVREPPVLAPESYAELLHALGFGEQHVRLQVYGHELASVDDVVEWVRGSLLTDYEARMSEAGFTGFFSIYRERVRAALGPAAPYFYAFKRILLWGRRGSLPHKP
jgi:trans-aconitate 2-methyltransferase